MARINQIQIRRGTDASVPTSGMVAGEPLFSTDNAKLYIATAATTKSWIGAQILDEDNMASDSATSLATQQSIKAYIANQITAEDLDFTTDTAGNSSVDLDSQVLSILGGEGMDVTHSGQVITVAGEDASTSNKGVASFSSSDFSVSSGAVSVASGGVSNAQLAGSIANSKLSGPSVAVTDGTTSSNISPGGSITFSGTSNEVEVSQSGGTVTVGLPDNVTITGNLTVNGGTTTVESATLVVEDPLIKLAKDNNTSGAGDAIDIGFYGAYYDASDTRAEYTGLFRDASDGKYSLFTGLSAEPSTTVNEAGVGYTLATLICGAVESATVDGGTY